MKIVQKYWIGFFALALFVIASALIYIKLHPKELPPNLIEGVGRFDGDLVNLNTKYPGRVQKIFFDDGDRIKKGDVVAVLGSIEYEKQKEALQKQIEAKQKELRAKENEFAVEKTKIPNILQKAKSAYEAKQKVLQELLSAISSQKEVVAQDRRDFLRIQDLYRKKLLQKHKLEEITLKYKTDKNRLKALLAKKDQLQEAIAIARRDVEDAKAAQRSLQAIEDGIEALKKAIAALQAQKAQIEAVINELTIKSSLDGYVVEKIANAGEVLGAGMPVATLIDPKTLYLKIYVDTISNGKIKLHDKAVIFLDAYPNKPIPAEVVRIAQKAEFTPKEVAVRSDRIQRVYAVHLKPIKPNPLLKLGLPAIGVISLDGKGLPKSLDEIPQI
ncbi:MULTISPECIES: HlyD family secretion protein [unclassified Nitratiruptor]|uniref:HlyD family secretion protein n=1 Tax=unclassified Nitratiruptor TaxID=2624044 RepID=UPI0019165D15|nr:MULTISPECIES: HlyD family efflux transporter periplasmic adaptor subunit [unclassified Nitratiruptor]BCD61003.1 HlyD family secretion protein [Nitratiruptor sp. YY08-10]BCD64935.1 HlyD family secretion protein [Nitratiruptor sp. YY08-14]